jgi:hypothetical protein
MTGPHTLSIPHRLALAALIVVAVALSALTWIAVYHLGRDAGAAPFAQRARVREQPLSLMAEDTYPAYPSNLLWADATTTVWPEGAVLTPWPEAPRYLQPLPDVLEQPEETASVITTLWRNGQIPQALIVLAFVVLSIASRKVPWLAEEHRGIYIAAALGGLGMLAEAASRGTTPNASMIMSALIVSLTLAMNGRAPAQVAAGLPVARALRSPRALPVEPTDPTGPRA